VLGGGIAALLKCYRLSDLLTYMEEFFAPSLYSSCEPLGGASILLPKTRLHVNGIRWEKPGFDPFLRLPAWELSLSSFKLLNQVYVIPQSDPYNMAAMLLGT
jgi:hypothetical protein